MTILESAITPVAATGLYQWAWLMVVLPLGVSFFLMLLGKAGNAWGHWLATLAALGSFGYAVVLFLDMLALPADQRAVTLHLYEWIKAGNWEISMGMLIDPLSILFTLLVTGVGSLIHIYSLGYMAHDERRKRFFAFLNFFIAAMLTLVLANDYVVLFLGWEGVGLASYLLISFWQHKESAAKAGRKAFVVNRVGDMGMVTGLAIMLTQLGSTKFETVSQTAADLHPYWATAMGLALLLAACGKSAQFPLQSWLLDAMEGPTPVSALIHAATMVTAGVYLVVRSNPIYAQTPTALTAVMVIGLITLLMGAWIGCAKDDIKKVLAGSTMSQIGYMLMCAGLGPVGYAFAIFHLLTHGFFKANMFLGAGSIMHAMNDSVNMRRFGGLAKVMPWTFITFAMGYLAILGIPGFAGFFSKDHIIEAAFEHNQAVGVMAILGAGITAFYMTRLMMMTFFGKRRWEDGVKPHESGFFMVLPLVLLAILSVGGGWILNSWIANWLNPYVGGHAHGSTPDFMEMMVNPLGWVTLGVVLLGMIVGWAKFRKNVPVAVPKTFNPLVVLGRRDLLAEDINCYVLREDRKSVV